MFSRRIYNTQQELEYHDKLNVHVFGSQFVFEFWNPSKLQKLQKQLKHRGAPPHEPWNIRKQ